MRNWKTYKKGEWAMDVCMMYIVIKGNREKRMDKNITAYQE